MSTLTKLAKAKSANNAARAAGKRMFRRGPSFGEWARRVSGMMKRAPRDLSMREGFGD